MAITTVKKEKLLNKAKEQVNVHKEVDTLFSIDSTIKALEAKLKILKASFSAKEKELYELIDLDHQPPSLPLAIEGKTHVLNLGAKAKKREIKDMEAVAYAFEDVQEGLFFKIAKVTMADVDKYLDEAQKEQHVAVSHSGSRSKKFTNKE